GLEVARDDAGTHADLAQIYARLERWPEAVRELEAALARESSPERRAALHYYAADAHARAGKPAAAIDHYMAAAQGGSHPRHALAAADRLAESTGATRQRVAALESLVEIADGPERARS